MPMGVVSNVDFESELSNCNPGPKSTKAIIVESPPKGRGENSVEVPDSLRKLIGSESVTNGRASALELANNLGISPSSVSAYSQGAKSTASYSDRPNLLEINQAKERISKRARNKLMLSLSHITEEKLGVTKVRDLAGIARDMSAIVRNIEPNEVNDSTKVGGPTFIFYSPQIRKEEHFDVIEMKE